MSGTTLPQLVRDAFVRSKEAGHLTFYPTQTSLVLCHGFNFQVHFSPSLAQKPKATKAPDRDATLTRHDPFHYPPGALHITDLGTEHYLVLNKFPVVPLHFILATKAYKPQTHLLECTDLGAIYTCLETYRRAGEELFGFFNSGEHSGASQAHRHVQFLPVESMRAGLAEAAETWQPLANVMLGKNAPDMPFAYFASRVPALASDTVLYETYRSLHRKATELVAVTAGLLQDIADGESEISYNMAFVHEAMILCPRVKEGVRLKSKDAKEVGPIALNGTLLGGTLLVKTEADWDALCNDHELLQEVLAAIGVPSSTIEPRHLNRK